MAIVHFAACTEPLRKPGNNIRQSRLAKYCSNSRFKSLVERNCFKQSQIEKSNPSLLRWTLILINNNYIYILISPDISRLYDTIWHYMILYDTIKHQKNCSSPPSVQQDPVALGHLGWQLILRIVLADQVHLPRRSTELEITLESLDIGTMLGYNMI